MAAFRTRRRVEFRDTDAAGLVHFSVFFTYMEQAEHELLRSVGLTVLQSDSGGAVTWPRVSASCDYRRPLRFEDEFEIEVALERLGDKSASYVFRFLLGGNEVATGRLVAVCCRIDPGKAAVPISIPTRLAEKLRPFLFEG
jgi:4-hydroxybenzoyl-CoA thioesterase/acyl-CoA thioester hydrolase